jgi:hypothetical protein
MKTYKKVQVPAIFEVYINRKMVNPLPFDRNYFSYFKEEIEKIDTGYRIPEITLISANVLSAKGFGESNYFFKNNTLFINNITDTFEFANGSYDGFNVFLNQIYLNKRFPTTNGTTQTGYSSTTFGTSQCSLDSALAKCKLTSINDIDEDDTLAFHSINVFYK